MRFFTWLIALFTGAFVILFAVANRHPVILFLEPFPVEMELPVYGILLGGFFVGFLVGGAIAGAASWKWRRAAKRTARRLELLERETANLRDRLGNETSPDTIRAASRGGEG